MHPFSPGRACRANQNWGRILLSEVKQRRMIHTGVIWQVRPARCSMVAMKPRDGLSSGPPDIQPPLTIIMLMLPLLLYTAVDFVAGPACLGVRGVVPAAGIIVAWYWFAPAAAPLLAMPGIIRLRSKAFVAQILLAAAVWGIDMWSCIQLFVP
jgi:hypothetical protein